MASCDAPHSGRLAARPTEIPGQKFIGRKLVPRVLLVDLKSSAGNWKVACSVKLFASCRLSFFVAMTLSQIKAPFLLSRMVCCRGISATLLCVVTLIVSGNPSLLNGCGASSQSSASPISYDVVVTATSGPISHSASVALLTN
jgi:hypothetical protein